MAKEYNSKGKNEVIMYLKAHNERRLTVAEILDGLKEEGISINRSTIYRNLDLQCNSCGKIFHLEHGFVDDFMDKLRKDIKVELDVSKTMLVGTCEKCLGK